MTNRLVPDPPLGDFPVLADDLRWRIEKPSGDEKRDLNPLRRVYLEKRVETKWLFGTKTKWVPVEWSVWRVRDGLGDFHRAAYYGWNDTKGLANTMAYILQNLEKRKREAPVSRYNDIHGVSKV